MIFVRTRLRWILASVLVLLNLSFAKCQSADTSTYRLKLWVDIPLTVSSVGAIATGLNSQGRSPDFSAAEFNELDADKIPWFDRSYKTVDPSKQSQMLGVSDVVLNISAIAPAFMMIDRRMRKQWLPILGLYIEAATVTGGIQTNSAVWIDRTRPITYLENASLIQRADHRNHHSMFSGHTSQTATGLFFTAKVLADLHPEWGAKRWWLYGGALVPSALVGWARMGAGKHFLSDVVVGLAVGAASGILVPHFHRRSRARLFSLVPTVSPNYIGARLCLNL